MPPTRTCEIVSADACEVRLRVDVGEAPLVTHRIEARTGSQIT
ncbi:MAG: hypothetical protein R2712_13350 [Vicinamibacterales bacterium]